MTESLEKARNEPKNFEAQVKGRVLPFRFDTIRRLSFYLGANQLNPTDYRTVVVLGMVNLDAGRFDTAEKWYCAAMKMRTTTSWSLRDWRKRRSRRATGAPRKRSRK